jgi:hypothetical protein
VSAFHRVSGPLSGCDAAEDATAGAIRDHGADPGVAGAIAIAVYEWVGLAFLRRGWINLDLVWVLALIGAGAILLVFAVW